MASSTDILTGYGPSLPGAMSASAVPVLKGIANWEDFKRKISAVFFELDLFEVVDPKNAGFNAFYEQYESEAAKKTAKAVAEHDRLHARVKLAVRILITKVDDSIAKSMFKTLPDKDQFSPSAIWVYLTKNFDRPATRAFAENFEAAYLSLLRLRVIKEKGGVMGFVRLVKQRLDVVRANAKVQVPACQRMMVSLVVRHVVDNLADDWRFREVREKYLRAIVTGKELAEVDALDKLFDELEMADVLTQSPQHKAKSWLNESQDGEGEANVSAVWGEVGDDSGLAKSGAYVMSLEANAQHTRKGHNVFMVDSGATHHCVRVKNLFDEFHPGHFVVHVANGKAIKAMGKGTVRVLVKMTNNNTLQLTLKDVLFVPSLQNNIFSTNHFVKASSNNYLTIGKRTILHVQHGSVRLVSEHNLTWLYTAKGEKPTTAATAAMTATVTATTAPAATASTTATTPSSTTATVTATTAAAATVSTTASPPPTAATLPGGVQGHAHARQLSRTSHKYVDDILERVGVHLTKGAGADLERLHKADQLTGSSATTVPRSLISDKSHSVARLTVLDLRGGVRET